MARHRINLMIMPQGETDRPIRSMSLPGYFPRLSIAVGILLAVVLLSTIVLTFYYANVARQVGALRTENRTLRDATGKMAELQIELNYHRDFTERVAELIGISVPQFQDSAVTALASIRHALAERSDSTGSSANGLFEGSELPTAGILATDCPPDTANRPCGMPLLGRISRGFSPDAVTPARRHTGIDLAVRENVPVLATADGTVEIAGEHDLYGFYVVLDHGNGFKTMYGHNSVVLVQTGDIVKRGDRIAFSGNTGVSTAPHLHYEITQNGQPVDPTPFLGQ